MKIPVFHFELGTLNLVLVALCATCGCGTSYSWRSAVPEEVRTVSVPTFRNESNVSELGAVATRQLLREFQREGTFKIRMTGDAALEIQGVIKSASLGTIVYSRRNYGRLASGEFHAEAEVSVIDKRSRKVLVDNRRYEATTTFTSQQDRTTAMRDASGRLADDLARQVVNDLLNLKW